MRAARQIRLTPRVPPGSINRLAGADTVNLTGGPVEAGDIPWPPEFVKTFVINLSTRPERMEGLLARFGDWSKHVTKLQATNGLGIRVPEWVKDRRTAPGVRLNRGQLGCYDSHVRAWTEMVEKGIPSALILEDDANIRHRHDHATRMRAALDEVNAKQPDWEFFYIGTGHTRNAKTGKHIGTCRGCQGLFAYVLKLEGARKLLASARPYILPVDVYVGKMIDSGQIKGSGMVPSLCYVVPVHSDTTFIR